MTKGYRFLFFAIELNLIMWLALAGEGLSSDAGSAGPWWSRKLAVSAPLLIIGFLLAAVVQHVAYYRMKGAASRSETVS